MDIEATPRQLRIPKTKTIGRTCGTSLLAVALHLNVRIQMIERAIGLAALFATYVKPKKERINGSVVMKNGNKRKGDERTGKQEIASIKTFNLIVPPPGTLLYCVAR